MAAYFNPKWPETILGDIKIYLHFLLFPDPDLTRVIEISPHGRQKNLIYPTWKIPWLLMVALPGYIMDFPIKIQLCIAFIYTMAGRVFVAANEW